MLQVPKIVAPVHHFGLMWISKILVIKRALGRVLVGLRNVLAPQLYQPGYRPHSAGPSIGAKWRKVAIDEQQKNARKFET